MNLLLCNIVCFFFSPMTYCANYSAISVNKKLCCMLFLASKLSCCNIIIYTLLKVHIFLL